MKKKQSHRRTCPIKTTPDCLSFSPLPTTPEMLAMTEEQMSFAGVSPHERLFWCSECENIWYETEHHFAHVIGKQASPGSPFMPSASRTRSIYIGS